MAQLGNLYVPNILRTPTKSCLTKCHAKKFEEFHQNEQQSSSLAFKNNTSRRSVISIASIALLTQIGTNNASLAEEENQLWLDGPLPGLRPAENSKYILCLSSFKSV